MRIGLIRHFPVDQRLPSGWMTAAELQLWRQQYDASRAILGSANLGSVQWTHCISSDLERAVATAKALFCGSVEQTTLLHEPDFAQFATGSLRLPVWIWRWILGLSWATGHHSQRACRDEFRRRVVATADLLESKAGDILVVSHAGIMAYLSAELCRRGFLGPKLRLPKHATLYIYDRNSAP
jgi:broad specificity phosphatase PhoE